MLGWKQTKEALLDVPPLFASNQCGKQPRVLAIELGERLVVVGSHGPDVVG